ncbi:MAG: hypothetical protein VCF07_04410 [Nitrospinota bacterium]
MPFGPLGEENGIYTATKDLVLPTTITGSLPRPGWFTENFGGKPFRVAMADMNFREQYLDNVSCVIRDQERAGLDIVTDGDARFDTDVGGRSWVGYVVQRLEGFSGYETSRAHASWGGSVPGEIMYEVLEARMLPPGHRQGKRRPARIRPALARRPADDGQTRQVRLHQRRLPRIHRLQ